MTSRTHRSVEHTVEARASVDTVYDVIADVANWPHLFPPTIHAEQISLRGSAERIRIWALADGEIRSWTSRRELRKDSNRIDFRQEISSPPIADMGGSWLFTSLAPDRTRVTLRHEYEADTPDQLAWIDRVVADNSRSELAGLKNNAETASARAELTIAFEDTVHIAAGSQAVFDFIDRADLWAHRLPHVASVRLVENIPGVQLLEMQTKSPDGHTHSTTSHRIVLDKRKIVYKQITLPALMRVHTGRWTFTDTAEGCTASSHHTVVLEPEKISEILGPDADVAVARDYVRTALSTNSRTTLEHAKLHAEQAEQ